MQGRRFKILPAVSDFCFSVISHAKEVKCDPLVHMITASQERRWCSGP